MAGFTDIGLTVIAFTGELHAAIGDRSEDRPAHNPEKSAENFSVCAHYILNSI